ncbi:MAG: ABC transporter ATP-binding protein [Actinomycetota bacterium]
MTTVELCAVSVAYDGVPVLEGLTSRFTAGSWVGLIGPNGAGKTTLLRAVAGLLDFDGDIRLQGVSVASLNRRRISRLVAYLPQRPVIPEAMTVADYALLGRTPYIPYLGSESVRDREIVAGVLRRLELEGFARRPLGSLSGGEVQRAVLGRALAQQAPLLLLDEPTSALDVGHQQQVLELVDELRAEHDLTVLSAMHDLTLAGQFADRLLLLAAGRAVAEGPAREVLTEKIILDHYGARVRLVDEPGGGVVVVPTRPWRPGAPVEARA